MLISILILVPYEKFMPEELINNAISRHGP